MEKEKTENKQQQHALKNQGETQRGAEWPGYDRTHWKLTLGKPKYRFFLKVSNKDMFTCSRIKFFSVYYCKFWNTLNI